MHDRLRAGLEPALRDVDSTGALAVRVEGIGGTRSNWPVCPVSGTPVAAVGSLPA